MLSSCFHLVLQHRHGASPNISRREPISFPFGPGDVQHILPRSIKGAIPQ